MRRIVALSKVEPIRIKSNYAEFKLNVQNKRQSPREPCLLFLSFSARLLVAFSDGCRIAFGVKESDCRADILQLFQARLNRFAVADDDDCHS